MGYLLSSGQLTALGVVVAVGIFVGIRLMAVKTTEGRCWRKGFYRLNVRAGKWSVGINLPYPEISSHPVLLFVIPLIVLGDVTVAWSSVGFTSVIWEDWGSRLHLSYRLIAVAPLAVILMLLLHYSEYTPTKDSWPSWIFGGILLFSLFQQAPLLAVGSAVVGLLLLHTSYENAKAIHQRASEKNRRASLTKRQSSVAP